MAERFKSPEQIVEHTRSHYCDHVASKLQAFNLPDEELENVAMEMLRVDLVEAYADGDDLAKRRLELICRGQTIKEAMILWILIVVKPIWFITITLPDGVHWRPDTLVSRYEKTLQRWSEWTGFDLNAFSGTEHHRDRLVQHLHSPVGCRDDLSSKGDFLLPPEYYETRFYTRKIIDCKTGEKRFEKYAVDPLEFVKERPGMEWILGRVEKEHRPAYLLSLMLVIETQGGRCKVEDIRDGGVPYSVKYVLKEQGVHSDTTWSVCRYENETDQATIEVKK